MGREDSKRVRNSLRILIYNNYCDDLATASTGEFVVAPTDWARGMFTYALTFFSQMHGGPVTLIIDKGIGFVLCVFEA